MYVIDSIASLSNNKDNDRLIKRMSLAYNQRVLRNIFLQDTTLYL